MKTKKETSSGVSLAINSTIWSSRKGNNLINVKKPSEFTIKVANTLSEREAVFNLGYQIYLEKGFINENANEWLIQNYDFSDETVILIVLDQNKKIAGSVTLVFNDSSKLPAEKIYKEEIKKLQFSGNKIAEISRLIISPEYRNSKEILLLLFNYLSIYTFHVKRCSHLIVEVNPRHKAFYQLILSFEEIGKEKLCPSVLNAPAHLLCLSFTKFKSEVLRCRNLKEHNIKERSFYHYFVKSGQESLAAHYLKKQSKPITLEEKIYFGFSESSIGNAICF